MIEFGLVEGEDMYINAKLGKWVKRKLEGPGKGVWGWCIKKLV